MTQTTDKMTTITDRPAWAEETRLEGDCIVHTWRAPTLAEVAEPNDVRGPMCVELVREDVVLVHEDRVLLDPGLERIVLDEFSMDAANARLLAAALSECADRIEQIPEG